MNSTDENILTLAFSSCPNDTFMFDAMIHHKVDTEGLEFEYHISDIEELNSSAFASTYDITKLSYHAFLYLYEKYALLRSGSALGQHVGPLLISKKPYLLTDIKNLHIAIPGKYTTANILLQLTLDKPVRVTSFLFSEIEDAVLNETVDAGVIIHENRFTYAQKGLCKLADLGELWAAQQNENIPLGGIVAKRSIPIPVQQKIERVLRRSIEFAFANPGSSLPFVKQYAQNMEDEVMKKHIQLYVNDFSIDLGKNGKESIFTLFKCAQEKGLIPEIKHREELFIPDSRRV